MSKIQAVRLINLNYNNSAIRISDETFQMNGESTLLSLRNGGGKSVLVQMMMAPFVHKRYRDVKERPFESYFTTNKPSFILVEWVLDKGAGYVLTGMMVRQNQDMDHTGGDALEMVNFISEYKEPCLMDIHHLPVVEKGKKEITLKGFAACRQFFESCKRDRSNHFFYFDMNNSAQSRQYFEKLKEYQINDKEWETIIKKVNLKESGLSELFSDCRDEKGLVEKWFLEAVESKLNKDKNRMKEFQGIVEKYVGQYKDNKSKIERRDTIRYFKEEALHISEKTARYKETQGEKESQEARIAAFIKELKRLKSELHLEEVRIAEELQAVRESIARIEYEKLSQEVHLRNEEKSFHVSNRDMVEMEQEGLEREMEITDHRLHLLFCAKQQEIVMEEDAELEVIRQKLSVFRKKEEELEPERKYLGYRLRCYYETRLEENLTQQRGAEEELEKTAQAIVELKEKIAGYEEGIRSQIGEQGGLTSKVEQYTQEEEQYNQIYNENLVRNILGEYEPGSLDIRRQDYEKELEALKRDCLKHRKELEGTEASQHSLERKLEDSRSAQMKAKLDLGQQEKLREKYEAELEVRSKAARYLELADTVWLEPERLLQASQRKLAEIEGLRRNMEKEEDVLQKEYRRLTQGKVLELPKELEDELNRIGIHVVYGMEWLQKNGYPEKKNRELVQRHPFLPYALLLSEHEVTKLHHNMAEIYTSFPIPIIIREYVEQEGAVTKDGLVDMTGVSFYVLFNENLLNEEKLSLLVKEKEEQIRKKKEAIGIRQAEYKEYFERQELIRNQEVSKPCYEANERELRELAERIAAYDREIRETLAELTGIKERVKQLGTLIQGQENDVQHQLRRLDEYSRLCEAYGRYEQNKEELARSKRETDKLKEKQKLSKMQAENQQELQKEIDIEYLHHVQENKQLRERWSLYERFEKTEAYTQEMVRLAQDAAKMEARYAAVTATISQELKELEQQEQKAAKRCKDAEEELLHLQNKYHVEKKAWQQISYSRKEESRLEILKEDRKQKWEIKRRLWVEADKQIAVLTQQIADCIERMQKSCGQDTPLKKEEIQNLDFDARKNKWEYRKRELQKEADKQNSQMQGYEENLTALSEYTEFTVNEEIVWEQDFSAMNREELRAFKGILLRDYNQKRQTLQAAKEGLVQVLNAIVRKEAFQEEFYKRPLEAMLELCDEALQVERQLETTILSYDSLMEKLQVDISLVEKEKKKIEELMEDYIQEVHKNLGKIDHNSTITVRDRPVKMLKIELPDWEENQNLYRMRLEDLMDGITRKGLVLFEKNENAQEYFGTQITTKNIYDSVVGIGNVQIRLYKIEEQREFPITWTEVARNSGGEGFLSAFVILTSLLYYMRKDDSDIFADKNEGKVLLMDNPFAQTNASHLLKPLMETAKKTNTQLICLTGLGGDSIYNRFDNIYVLNLITASLRNGMQYLRADHVRGDEPQTMVVSQIEVIEQQELVF